MVMRVAAGGVVALAVLAAGAPAAGQPITGRSALSPGDVLRAGDGSHPAGATYRVVGCEPVEKPNRQCTVQRLQPDPEARTLSLTIENYTDWTKVGGGAAAAPARAAPAPVRTVVSPPPPAAAPSGGDCPHSPYGGPVPGTRPASAALFQQKITDSITMGAYGRFWYGVRLTGFSVGAPIRNVVSVKPGVGAMRVNTGAPPAALMYPVSTTMSVCDGAPNGGSSWRTSAKKYLCFVSAADEWTCGASS